MSLFSVRAFTDVSLNGRPVYAILREGRLIGELCYVLRPKRDGGPAWEAALFRKRSRFMAVKNHYYGQTPKVALARLKADALVFTDIAEERWDLTLKKPNTRRRGELINDPGAALDAPTRFEFHRGKMTAR